MTEECVKFVGVDTVNKGLWFHLNLLKKMRNSKNYAILLFVPSSLFSFLNLFQIKKTYTGSKAKLYFGSEIKNDIN